MRNRSSTPSIRLLGAGSVAALAIGWGGSFIAACSVGVSGREPVGGAPLDEMGGSVGTPGQGTSSTGASEISAGPYTTGLDPEGSTSSGEADGGDSTSTGGQAETMSASVYEVRQGELDVGDEVRVTDVVVTGVLESRGAFVQERAGGPFGGIWVAVESAELEVGDLVEVRGVVDLLEGLARIDARGPEHGVQVEGRTDEFPAPALLDVRDEGALEPWESSLVRIEGVFTIAGRGDGGEFVLDDPAWVVDDFLFDVWDAGLFDDLEVGAGFEALEGPLNFDEGVFKLAPRGSEDFEGYRPAQLAPAALSEVATGELVVTEVMYNPACAQDDCEWIEIYNRSPRPIDLQGLIIEDSQRSPDARGVVSRSAVIGVGEFAVLARGDGSSWPYAAVPVLAHYGDDPPFNNSVGGDQVILRTPRRVLDETAVYSGRSGDDNGISWQLRPDSLDAVANDDADNWCWSGTELQRVEDTVERGTPGRANDENCG